MTRTHYVRDIVRTCPKLVTLAENVALNGDKSLICGLELLFADCPDKPKFRALRPISHYLGFKVHVSTSLSATDHFEWNCPIRSEFHGLSRITRSDAVFSFYRTPWTCDLAPFGALLCAILGFGHLPCYGAIWQMSDSIGFGDVCSQDSWHLHQNGE